MEIIGYVGLDVHKDTYSACFSYFDGSEVKFALDAKLEASTDAVLKFIENGRKLLQENGITFSSVICGYEAGCLGYSLQKELSSKGYECRILAPTTIVKSKDKVKKKNDYLDARNIGQNMCLGLCKYIHILTDHEREVRDYLRLYAHTKKQLKREKQYLLSSLLKLGKKYQGGKYWTDAHFKWLKKLELSKTDRIIVDSLLSTIEGLIENLENMEKEVEKMSEEPEFREKVDALCCIKGISTLTALTILTEVGDMNRFARADQFSAYLGLTPGMLSSADKCVGLGITKQGNARIRTLLVEAIQSYSRTKSCSFYKSRRIKQKQSGQAKKTIDYADKASRRITKRRYDLIASGKNDNKMVTACARELAGFVWGMLTNHME